MEFKDKLKNLRKEKGLSQQALADAIFVSRSAVAKWENGLGLPSAESRQALLDYFGVTESYFATEEPETVIVKKNKRIAALGGSYLLLICAILLFLLLIFPHTKAGMKLTVVLFKAPLDSYAQTLLDSPPGEEASCWGFDAVCYPDAQAVFFEYHRGGYTGFFYSADGAPVGFQGTDMTFASYGRNRWLWHEETGDNWMQAEHIIGNWYWYDMNF